MRPEHIQRSRVGSCSAALPAWAAGKFTDGQAAVMRAIGIEMLNKRGICALHLKIIAAAAGVSVGRRDALNIADTIGLITAGHLRGFYDMRIRSPEWLPALRERIEWSEQLEEAQTPAKSAKHRVWEIAENILNTDAARLPRRGNGRVQVAELARQVRVQMAAEGEPPPLGMIDKYIRTHVRQWEDGIRINDPDPPGEIGFPRGATRARTPEREMPHDEGTTAGRASGSIRH
jgi:hypothetical protein